MLAAARERGQFARWAAGLAAGLRQGEALGLRWGFLDIDVPDGTEGEIRVWAQLQRFAWAHGCDDPARCARKHCKTRACPAVHPAPGTCPPPCPDDCAGHALHCPRRTLPRGSIRLNGALVLRETVKEKKRKTVPIPAELCEVLRDHRSAQFEQRMLAGSEWTDHDLVFTRWDGQPVDPRRDWQEWARILEAAGIPHSRRAHRAAHRGDDRHRPGGRDHGGPGTARALQRPDHQGLRPLLLAGSARRPGRSAAALFEKPE